jgi:hypothetical protein
MIRLAALLLLSATAFGELRVGVARIDITPDYPVRLSGFGFRRAESEGVTQPIHAKAIAFVDGPVLITTDNLGVPDAITRAVAERLGLPSERVTITASHSHTAPMLRGVAPTLFGMEIPAEHQDRIDRYTREFTDRLVEVARAALREARPARVEWGRGVVGFAKNRRSQGGPVDHDLPVLVVREPENGKVRAVWFAYACHCVTLSDNKLSGDWAGFAQSEIERDSPGAVALMSAGCGADANPDSGVTGDKAGIAAAQGRQIADEVKRLLTAPLVELKEVPATKLVSIDLPFDTPRVRAEWEERAAKPGAVGYHARVNLARLDRGETLQAKIGYPVQTWRSGAQLALVFLPGEVVVDYALRLKRELDAARLAVVAYANDAPCYIPSERVLKEGGYEGEGAMIYYDRPHRPRAGIGTENHRCGPDAIAGGLAARQRKMKRVAVSLLVAASAHAQLSPTKP